MTLSTRPDRRIGFAAALLLTVLASGSAQAQGYPRLALYGQMYGTGFPLWDSTGTLQSPVLDAIARYDEVVIEAAPITPYRPDAIAALRLRNPRITMLAYVAPTIFFFGLSSDSLVDYPSRLIRSMRNMNGYLYRKSGGVFTNDNINMAKRDGFGRFVVAETLAVLWNDAILKSGLWDGIFIDVYCNGIGWMETPAESIDYIRAGYSSFSAFDAAWKAGTDTLADRLRQLAGPSIVLVGNCSNGSKYIPFNGWMRENFPYQGGGNWYSNMFNDPGGYVVDEARFRAPTHNYIFSAFQGTQPYASNNTRKVRFGLATAALGSGFGVFGPSSRLSYPYPYHLWWYDEYAVDLTTGQAVSDLSHTGWLGQPLGPYYQMIWAGTAPDAVTNAGFETDASTGWTLFTTMGSTMTRDPVGAGVGAASAHITVPIAGSVPWTTAISTIGTIDITNGLTCSATFWAHSDRVRTIRVVAARTTSGEFISQNLTIGTGWKQYQVALVPPASGAAQLAFYLGGEAGDVWLDDCHFQVGATTLYRRDFQNGLVLVNPSNSPLTVPLERTFRKITGLADPAINDGQNVAQAMVGASDALFLIGSDQIPPANVGDLHRIP